MSGIEIAAIITAAFAGLATLLGLLGGAVKYVVSLILDAYKRQAESTLDAKNNDLKAKDQTIAAKDQVIAQRDAEIARLQTEVITRLTDLRAQLSNRVAP